MTSNYDIYNLLYLTIGLAPHFQVAFSAPVELLTHSTILNAVAISYYYYYNHYQHYYIPLVKKQPM